MFKTEPKPDPVVDSELAFSNAQWFYRRRLAFRAFWVGAAEIALVTGAVAFSDTAAARLNNFQGFLGTAVAALLSLTGAYMGFATWQDIKTPLMGPRPGSFPPTPGPFPGSPGFGAPGQTPTAPPFPGQPAVPVPAPTVPGGPAPSPFPGPRFPRRGDPACDPGMGGMSPTPVVAKG